MAGLRRKDAVFPPKQHIFMVLDQPKIKEKVGLPSWIRKVPKEDEHLGKEIKEERNEN